MLWSYRFLVAMSTFFLLIVVPEQMIYFIRPTLLCWFRGMFVIVSKQLQQNLDLELILRDLNNSHDFVPSVYRFLLILKLIATPKFVLFFLDNSTYVQKYFVFLYCYFKYDFKLYTGLHGFTKGQMNQIMMKFRRTTWKNFLLL